ncbi:arylesterase/monooxygenase [Plectosphaerella plurivora]|uniref:Arylesterase/monooxygenase n=1 Tax=Plectosphaerella plurivora TaxID=936078 RepID=A0A9P8V9P1_9PEZI|nr:arylesterase/monooxygenase [Plectosphaerella plurivora]
MPLSWDPEVAEAFKPVAALFNARPAAPVHDVETRRAAMAAFSIPHIHNPAVKVTVHEVELVGGDTIQVHAFEKNSPGSDALVPAVIHSHGGGMIAGDITFAASGIQAYVESTGVSFFSVEYRLAPENTDTGLVEDVYAGLLWLHQNAGQFNVDPTRIGVMGESAGGGIAAGVALMARDKGLSPPLAKQILVYPMLDDRNCKSVRELEATGLIWSFADNLTGWGAVLGKDRAGDPDADVSYFAVPARAKSVAGLPSTYIDVGGLDIFRNEDMAYASRIAAENIDVEFHVYPGVPHGWELFASKTQSAIRATANRARALMSF